MRFLVLLAALVLVAVVLVMLFYSFTSQPGAPEKRWEVHTEAGDGATLVLVRQLDAGGREHGRQQVAEIPDAVPDWDARYHAAMAEARSRLAAIESQKDG